MQSPTAMAAPHGFPDLDAAKRAMRQQAMRARAEYVAANPDGPGAQAAASGAALAGHLLRVAPPAPGGVVSGFWPLGAEIDIRSLLKQLHDRGHRIALPVTPQRGHPLSFRLWRPDDPMERERFGTLRPTGAPIEPDYLLVPLLAFDRRCHRLGYGAGYYDRTLAGLGPHRAIGCAYAVQQVDSVPTGPYDVALDAVATERGVIFREAG